MSKARADIDFEKMIDLAIEPEKPRRYRESSMPHEKYSCTMCDKMRSMRTMKKLMNGENPQL